MTHDPFLSAQFRFIHSKNELTDVDHLSSTGHYMIRYHHRDLYYHFHTVEHSRAFCPPTCHLHFIQICFNCSGRYKAVKSKVRFRNKYAPRCPQAKTPSVDAIQDAPCRSFAHLMQLCLHRKNIQTPQAPFPCSRWNTETCSHLAWNKLMLLHRGHTLCLQFLEIVFISHFYWVIWNQKHRWDFISIISLRGERVLAPI